MLTDHARVLERMVEWARVDDNIRVVLLTGSVPVGSEQVAALSDVDVELYVTEPARLLEHDAWYAQFGTVLVVEALPTRAGIRRGWCTTSDDDGAARSPVGQHPARQRELPRVRTRLLRGSCDVQYVVRDEPWQAKLRDWDLKRELIRMMAWNHKARYGWSYHTWRDGKHLKRWLDSDILGRLDACWAGFASPDRSSSAGVGRTP